MRRLKPFRSPARLRAILILFFSLFVGYVGLALPQTNELPGTWQLTPLVTKSTATPDGAGTIQEFGDTYVMEDFFVFWGRFGSTKEWGLFSLKNGKLSRILISDADFIAADGRRIKVSRAPTEGAPVFHVGKRMLYVSARKPDHVYGWNGETWFRILGGGEVLNVAGVPHQVKRATVLDVDRSSGQALLYWDSSQPEAEGWALHDGTNLSALWKEGDHLPGRPAEERIKNLSSGLICTSKCVPAARLLPGGSIIAVVETTSGTTSLVRISRDKTEMLEGSTRKILAANGTDYIADVSKWVTVGNSVSLDSDLLLHYDGKSYLHEGVRADGAPAGVPAATGYGSPFEMLLTAGKDTRHLGYDEAVFLNPNSPRALVTVQVSAVEKKGSWKAEVSAISFPGLYFLSDRGVMRIAWESAVGLSFAAVPHALRSPVHGFNARIGAQFGDVPIERIHLRKLDGPVPGVQVELPKIGSGIRHWFVPAGSPDGKLVREPKFNVPGQTLTIADVLAWKSPDTALVGLEDGYFLLERVAGK